MSLISVLKQTLKNGSTLWSQMCGFEMVLGLIQRELKKKIEAPFQEKEFVGNITQGNKHKKSTNVKTQTLPITLLTSTTQTL